MPVIALIFTIGFFGCWAFTAAYVMSIGEIRPMESIPFLATVYWSDEIRYALIY